MRGTENDVYSSDVASSPLSVSEASSDVGIGELIHIEDDMDNETSAATGHNTKNHCNSKQAKKVNRILKNVDKDLARIKEREASRSISPDRLHSVDLTSDTVSVALSCTPSPTFAANDKNQFFGSNVGNQSSGVKVINDTNNESSWFSRGGLLCFGSIILAVIIICLIAYHFDHSKLFLSNSSNHHHEHENDKSLNTKEAQ